MDLLTNLPTSFPYQLPTQKARSLAPFLKKLGVVAKLKKEPMDLLTNLPTSFPYQLPTQKARNSRLSLFYNL
jgi:hypothetical protein